MKTFSIDQIKTYLLSEKIDSLGDAVHFLSEEAIDNANKNESEDMKLFEES